ncbi:hypothetical protein OG730_05825 [Streptomyces sp. NBC_01298]|uniref:hypothetical protein n=1 Tax=Streptomyces sp. NBC_01298 TaxID=2903817 RepID=UPI002E158F66|nr:hypothetical protein OG730_05825 [Streptomyces sp. NBC_01298]
MDACPDADAAVELLAEFLGGSAGPGRRRGLDHAAEDLPGDAALQRDEGGTRPAVPLRSIVVNGLESLPVRITPA